MSAEKKWRFSQLIVRQQLGESQMCPITTKLQNMSAHVRCALPSLHPSSFLVHPSRPPLLTSLQNRF
jgi:hypothetical protein